MADKKIFTIEIDGVKQAYDNIIKLKDAINILENIELNIKDGISESLENIKKNESELISKGKELEEQIKTLTEEYKNLDTQLKDGQAGQDKLNEIRELNREHATTLQQLKEHNSILSEALELYQEEINSITQRKDLLGELNSQNETFSNTTNDLSERLAEVNRQLQESNTSYQTLNETLPQITQNTEELANQMSQESENAETLRNTYEELIPVLEEVNRNRENSIEAINNQQSAVDSLTEAVDNSSNSTSERIEMDRSHATSINGLSEQLKKLQEEYNNLSKAERDGAKGRELARSINDITTELDKLERKSKQNLNSLGSLGNVIFATGERLKNSTNTLTSFRDILSNSADVVKLFGVENEGLNATIEGMSKVIGTLNTIQALHTSLVSKDSIVMKTASAITSAVSKAKELLTRSTQGSTVATRGATVATRGFSTALASTGIGAIVILLGLLFTNFDDIKKILGENIEGFDRFSEVMEEIEPVLHGVGNVIVKYLMQPIKQVMNLVEGLINVIGIFKNKGISGFKDALDEIGKTTDRVKKTVIDSFSVVTNYNEGILLHEQKRIKQQLKMQVDAKLEAIKHEEEKYGATWKFTEEGKKAYLEYFELQAELYKDDEKKYKELMRQKEIYEYKFTEHNKPKPPTDPKRDLKKEQEEYEKALQNLQDSTQQYQQNVIEKEIEFSRKIAEIQSNSEISESKKLELENLKIILDEKIAARKKALDEEIKIIKDENLAREKAAAAEKEIDQARIEAKKIIAQAESDAINEVLDTRNKALTTLKEIHDKESKLLQEKFEKESRDTTKHYEELMAKNILDKAKTYILEKAFIEQMDALKKKHDKEKEELENNQQSEILSAKNEVEKIKKDIEKNNANSVLMKIDEELIDSKQKLNKILSEDVVKRNKLGLIDVAQTKKNLQNVIDANKEHLKELENNKNKKIEILDELIKQYEGDAQMQAYFLNLKKQILQSYEKEYLTIQGRIAQKEEDQQNQTDKMLNELHDKIKDKWDKIGTIMKLVGSTLTSAIKVQLEEIQKKQEEVGKLYDQAVEKHKASQEKLKSLEEEAKNATGGRAMAVQEQIARQMEANNELAKQEKDLAKQKEKLEKDKAKKEKQMKKIELGQQLISGIATTALAAIKAYLAGPIWGPILAASISAAGAVQTGIIASQIAKLEDGGLLRGKRHSQGGMRIEGTNIEVEGDEYVVNRISTSKNKGLIEYINKNRRELNANDINSYFARSPRQANQQPELPTKRMFQEGGMLTNLEVVDNIKTPDNEKILNAISQINFQPVVSVVDIASAQDNLSQVKDIAGA